MRYSAAGGCSSSKRTRWLVLAAVGLLAFCAQAGAAKNEEENEIRESTRALLNRALNESNRRAADLPSALTRIEQGLQRTRDDDLEHAKWLEVLWFYYLLHDDHARGRATIEESLRLMERANADPELIADTTITLAYSLTLVGEIARAKERLRHAIVIATPRGNSRLLADLYFSLADAYRKTGESLVAERYFEATREIDRAVADEEEEASSSLKLGSVARDKGNYREAIGLHVTAMLGFGKDNYRKIVAVIELARDCAAQGDFDSARNLIERHVLGDSRTLPEQQLDAKILLLKIANDSSDAGHETTANARQAARLMREIESLIQASATRQQSEIARPTHQLQFAEQAIRRLAIDRKASEIKARGDATIQLVRRVAADLRAGNDDAMAWLAQAQPALNQYVKALYDTERTQVFPLLETYYSTASARPSGVMGRAFEVAAVELFDDYVAAETALVNVPVGEGAAAKAKRFNRLLRQRDLARDRYLATYQAPFATTRPSLPKAAGNYQGPQVPATDVVIRYFIQENVSFGAVLSQRGVAYFDLPARSTVQRLVQRALDAVRIPSGDIVAGRAALTDLARLLPPDFRRKYAGATRLIVVADDAVQPVPFAAINLSEDPHEYEPLVSRFEILRTRSVSRYYAKQPRDTGRDRAAPMTSDLVVFADPETSTDVSGGPAEEGASEVTRDWTDQLARLPSSQLEARYAADAFADRGVWMFLGPAARNDVLLSPAVRSARVLHLATHGHFNQTVPDIVGFATSTSTSNQRDGGYIGFTELFTSPFFSRLVVVSSCESMRGQDYSGWGVRSLADGFLAGGAGSVIGTLWRIPDRTTAELMKVFYRSLRDSQGDSSFALREAQLWQLRSKQPHPYFWAAFVLESTNRRFDRHAL